MRQSSAERSEWLYLGKRCVSAAAAAAPGKLGQPDPKRKRRRRRQRQRRRTLERTTANEPPTANSLLFSVLIGAGAEFRKSRRDSTLDAVVLFSLLVCSSFEQDADKQLMSSNKFSRRQSPTSSKHRKHLSRDQIGQLDKLIRDRPAAVVGQRRARK